MDGVDLNGAADLAPRDEPGCVLNMPTEHFAGVWANHAAISKTAHEYTIDFFRIGPQGREGVCVSRVNCSALLFEQLLEAMQEQVAG